MSECIWGVDLGMDTTVIAAVGEEPPIWHRPGGSKGTISDRLGRLCEDVERGAGLLLKDRPPIFVLIEQPFGRHVHPHLHWACGAVTLGIYRATRNRFKYPVSIAHIGSPEWKKGLGLKGNAPKSEVIAWARGHISPQLELDEHAADALGIATYGFQTRSPSLETRGEGSRSGS